MKNVKLAKVLLFTNNDFLSNIQKKIDINKIGLHYISKQSGISSMMLLLQIVLVRK